MHEYSDFPATCECLAECQRLNLRVEYAKGCANTTRHPLEPENSPRKAEVPYPWHDRFGDGKWMQQPRVEQVEGLAGRPGRGEAAVQRSEAQLAQRLHKDGAASAASQLCSGRGILTANVPFLGTDRHKGRGFCHCFPGWFGERCDIGPGHPKAPPAKQQSNPNPNPNPDPYPDPNPDPSL